MIKAADLPLTAIVFTHFDEVSGAQTDVWVSGLIDSPECQDLEEVLVPVIPEHAELCAKIRGIEEHRLRRLLATAPRGATGKEFPQYPPILLAQWPDGSYLNIDGSHRYVAARALGYEFILAKCVPETLWRQYQIDGLPTENQEAVLKSFSGIR